MITIVFIAFIFMLWFVITLTLLYIRLGEIKLVLKQQLKEIRIDNEKTN